MEARGGLPLGGSPGSQGKPMHRVTPAATTQIAARKPAQPPTLSGVRNNNNGAMVRPQPTAPRAPLANPHRASMNNSQIEELSAQVKVLSFF